MLAPPPPPCRQRLAVIGRSLPSPGLLQDREGATEALQVSCLLLPPPNRRRLQLLLRLMARVCRNPQLPPLNDSIGTRTLVQLGSSGVVGTMLLGSSQDRAFSAVACLSRWCRCSLTASCVPEMRWTWMSSSPPNL